MEKRKSLDKKGLAEKEDIFIRVVRLIFENMFQGDVPVKFSVTLLEGLMVGISGNLEKLEKKSTSSLLRLFRKLQEHEEFSPEKLSEGLSGRQRVIDRLTAARQIFSA